MPSTHTFTPTDNNEREQVSPTPLPVSSVDETLDETDRVLHQILLLAELSTIDGTLTGIAPKEGWNAFKL